MDFAVKAQWVAALRSGKYKQGKHRLRSDADEFCCLGVLCDISPAARWNGTRAVGDSGGIEDASIIDLPRSVQHWAGLPTTGPVVKRGSLSALNDQGVPFSEIADLIERDL